MLITKTQMQPMSMMMKMKMMKNLKRKGKRWKSLF